MQYMEELLRQGESFEFFLEGGRSRSGKVLYPKGGLLSVVADAYLTGEYHRWQAVFREGAVP